MGQIFLRRFQLVTQFRQALETGQVDVHYQPKVALPSRQVIGVEALVRWKHPEFGCVDPDEFVPAVEATGLIDVLTDFVLRQGAAKGPQLAGPGPADVRRGQPVGAHLADAEFPDRGRQGRWNGTTCPRSC